MTRVSIAILILLTLSCFSASRARADLHPIIEKAVSGDDSQVEATIKTLREKGPQALEQLIQYRERLEKELGAGDYPFSSETESRDPQLARLDHVIDGVGGARYCSTSRLYWFTDLERAKSQSAVSGKPILSLRLMGKLTDEYSCANSRFFRTSLYANKDISKLLRDRFVLHWKTVRPVPRVTIDFGDGRKLERTLTGNSAHYILSTEGRPLDILPGLYGPQAFTDWLNRSLQLASDFEAAESTDREEVLAEYHSDRLKVVESKWSSDLAEVAPDAITKLLPDADTGRKASEEVPNALEAANIAVGKSEVEIPILENIELVQAIHIPADQLEEATSEDLWEAIAALHREDAELDEASVRLMRRHNPTAAQAGRIAETKRLVEDPLVRIVERFERSIALDAVRNEYMLHRQIHQWFAGRELTSDFDALNARVYAQLFLTPDADPWLGLITPDTYTALPNDGVSRN